MPGNCGLLERVRRIIEQGSESVGQKERPGGD